MTTIYATYEKNPNPANGMLINVDMADPESIERFIRRVNDELCEHDVTVTRRTLPAAEHTIRLDDTGGAFGRDNTATIDASDSDFASMAARLYRVGIYVTPDVPAMPGGAPTVKSFREWCERQNANDTGTTETIEYGWHDWDGDE